MSEMEMSMNQTEGMLALESNARMVAIVAVCCSVLQRVAVCCSVLQCVAACCSVLQCVAVCCSVLQCVKKSGGGHGGAGERCSVLQCVSNVALCCRVSKSQAEDMVALESNA